MPLLVTENFFFFSLGYPSSLEDAHGHVWRRTEDELSRKKKIFFLIRKKIYLCPYVGDTVDVLVNLEAIVQDDLGNEGLVLELGKLLTCELCISTQRENK